MKYHLVVYLSRFILCIIIDNIRLSEFCVFLSDLKLAV